MVAGAVALWLPTQGSVPNTPWYMEVSVPTKITIGFFLGELNSFHYWSFLHWLNQQKNHSTKTKYDRLPTNLFRIRELDCAFHFYYREQRVALATLRYAKVR
jgi:hypothetical protein